MHCVDLRDTKQFLAKWIYSLYTHPPTRGRTAVPERPTSVEHERIELHIVPGRAIANGATFGREARPLAGVSRQLCWLYRPAGSLGSHGSMVVSATLVERDFCGKSWLSHPTLS
jgi:hypothetical protein